jgi:hypothetical protein
MKPRHVVASATEFHEWTRTRFRGRGFVFQDVDLFASDARTGFRPAALVELKRSFIPVDEWRPFADDRPNYAALVELAKAVGLPVFVVYFVKGRPVVDASPLAVFRLDAALPEYELERELMSAGDFADRFPLPIIRPADVF